MLKSIANEKSCVSPFKTFYKKQLVVKSKATPDDTTLQLSKASSLNITDECDEARVKMRP